jgi:assimilatory nitrate reductase catalytic subunit
LPACSSISPTLAPRSTFGYIEPHVVRFRCRARANARAIGRTSPPSRRLTGLDAGDDIAAFALWFRHERVVTAFSQGVNQSAQGTDKVAAILNCHLATGRIGKPGMGPFSLTGQPNAMGGREVGGLANMLAAHMGYLA